MVIVVSSVAEIYLQDDRQSHSYQAYILVLVSCASLLLSPHLFFFLLPPESGGRSGVSPSRLLFPLRTTIRTRLRLNRERKSAATAVCNSHRTALYTTERIGLVVLGHDRSSHGPSCLYHAQTENVRFHCSGEHRHHTCTQNGYSRGEGGGFCHFMHSRVRITLDSRMSTFAGTVNVWFYPPGRHCLLQARYGIDNAFRA